MTTDFSAAVQFIENNNSFLIVSHQRPDGDALGSAAGLCSALNELGKTAFILNNPQTTSKYIPYVSPFYPPPDFAPNFVISVDMADLHLLQLNAEPFKNSIALAVDHHKSNSAYADINLVLSDKSSCGEVIYLLLTKLGIPVSARTAQLLYIAVASDTGCFRYKNTTAETLSIASALVSLGAPNGVLNKKLFMTHSKNRLALESLIIRNLHFYRDGELVIAVITADMLSASGASEEDLEDIAVIAGQIDGVETSVTIQELKDGKSKVSVRTVYYANANTICAQLGGGGHGMAAGCTLDCNIDEAKVRILDAVSNVWKQGMIVD